MRRNPIRECSMLNASMSRDLMGLTRLVEVGSYARYEERSTVKKATTIRLDIAKQVNRERI